MVEDVNQCVEAEASGADRLELCGPGDGGLTPHIDIIRETLEKVNIPTHVMIRPRAGDFNYSDDEFKQMIQSVNEVKATGAAGVVFGILKEDKTLDTDRMRVLIEAAHPMRIVCHKAFDETPNGLDAINELIKLGVKEVLTSGHAKTAAEGA
jgi:copper homeostasis protein